MALFLVISVGLYKIGKGKNHFNLLKFLKMNCLQVSKSVQEDQTHSHLHNEMLGFFSGKKNLACHRKITEMFWLVKQWGVNFYSILRVDGRPHAKFYIARVE